MIDHQFEWSESGLRLLAIINEIIKQNGGVEEMHTKIVRENTMTRYKNDKINLMEKLKLLRGKVPVGHIPAILGIPDSMMYTLLHEMGEIKKPKNEHNNG